MSVTPISRPACLKSRLGAVYLLVVANGRIAKERTSVSVFAISSGSARRRKSASLSDPTFWNGRTATVLGPAESPEETAACLNFQRSREIALSRTIPASHVTFLRVCPCQRGVGTALGGPDLSLRSEPESRLARVRSARISEAC